MHIKPKQTLSSICFFIVAAACGLLWTQTAFAQKKSLSNEEAMSAVRRMDAKIISENGNFVAYSTYPDRGNYEGCVWNALKDSTIRIENARTPQFSKDARWTFFRLLPTAVETANDKDKKLKNGLAIVNNETGEVIKIKNVGSYIPSNDGKWLAYFDISNKPEKPDKKVKKRPVGKQLVLRYLPEATEISLNDVATARFDSTSTYFAFSVNSVKAEQNGLYYINLKGQFALPKKIDVGKKIHVANLTWNNKQLSLAYTAGKENYCGAPDSVELKLWNPQDESTSVLVDKSKLAENLRIPYINDLKWTEDGNRLFFGTKLQSDTSEFFPEITYNDTNFYNIDTILTQTTMDLWHVKDPRIKTWQHVWWDSNKDMSFTAVFDMQNMRYVQLADSALPNVDYAENPNYTIGYDELPYLYKSTWDMDRIDIYKVNLQNGEKTLLVKEVYNPAYLSPLGNFIAFYNDKQWYLHNTQMNQTTCLTDKMSVAFYEEKDDHPREPDPYGIGGWLDNDEGLLLYDNYDIWLYTLNNIGTQAPLNVTDSEGRRAKTRYRIIRTNHKKPGFSRSEPIFLTKFDTWKKTHNIAELDLSIIGTTSVTEDTMWVNLVAKAREADKYIFTKEAYDVYPDLWYSDHNFLPADRVTNFDSTISQYTFGKMHLMDYVSAVGDTLQGYYIVPDDFDPSKRYPTVVFFYELQSDDAYRFSNGMMPWNNHLPTGPMYASDGYVLFFPDIRFQVGSPGQSSIDCLVPACRKLAQLGVTDSNAIGLWGHSWSGYQGAYIITQTDFFKCVIAGAAVGNMTSAYSGIRYGSGLTRQFQYEYGQSRIGGSLWDSLDSYIRNSPVFFANKVHTPILLEFGNQDDCVPWTQGMELFLALRRAQKDVIMIEYRDEPHHPHKYYNRLDYNIRMKQYYDHYLKGKPAADWIKKGIEYRGK